MAELEKKNLQKNDSCVDRNCLPSAQIAVTGVFMQLF